MMAAAPALKTGTPAGEKGTSTQAITTANAAHAWAVRLANLGHNKPRKAAAAAASRPQALGSPRALPTRAPARVSAFQQTKTPTPAHQNPVRRRVEVVCAVETAVDSSMVNCAARTFFHPWNPSKGPSCTPYKPLRTPNKPDVRTAETALPPAPRTPMKANCDPPVNMSRDKAMVCHRFRPAAMDNAPKEIPYNPVATDTDNACLMTAARAGSRCEEVPIPDSLGEWARTVVPSHQSTLVYGRTHSVLGAQRGRLDDEVVMGLVDAIAFCGAVLAAGNSVPQFALVVRTKDTHGLALTTWVIALGTGIGWLAHGIKLLEPNMIWPNTWGVIVTVTILYFLRRNGRYTSLTTLLPGIGIAALLIGLDNFVGSAAFGFCIVVPQAYGMVRQGIALMRAPQVSGVSVTSWIVQVLNQIMWLIWAVMTHEAGTFIASVVSLVAASFVLLWRVLRACGVGPICVNGKK